MKLSCCLLILTVSVDLSLGFTLENVASNGTSAFGSFNTSLHPVPQALLSSPAHHDIIAKEGTSILIECKLNISQYEYILWYNSRGHLLEQKDEGELFCYFMTLGILLLYDTWKHLRFYCCFVFLSFHFYSLEIGREQAPQIVLCLFACGGAGIIPGFMCPSPSILQWCPTELFCSRDITVCSAKELSASYQILTDLFIYYCSGLYFIFPNAWIKHASPQLWPFMSWQTVL